MSESITFKEAYERLKQIYEYLTKNEVVDVDELIKLQDEAEKLYKICKLKIEKIDNVDKK